ncbi:monocarboxylate transporter 12-like [Glandiceps talaboti]
MTRRNRKVATEQDGGVYGWLIVLACHVCSMFMLGVYVSIGPVFIALQDYFDSGSARTSWIVALFMCLTMGLGPIANILVKKIGYRRTVMLGGLVSSIGFLLTAFAPSLEFIYFSFGILSGCGYGLILSPELGIVGLYIRKRYALANALVMCGAGTGAFIFSPIWQLLIDTYGWRGAFIIFSAINANLCVCGALFRTPLTSTAMTNIEMESSQHQISSDVNETGEISADKPSTLRKCCDVCDFGLFTRYPTYSLIPYALCLGVGVGFYGAPAHIVARAKSKSLASERDIALIIPIFAAVGLIGRISPAILSHHKFRTLSSLRIFASAFILSGITHLLSSLADSYTTYCVYAAFLGLFTGVFFTLFSHTINDIVGPTNLTAGISAATPCEGLGGLIGPPIAGWIYDVTNDYDNSFYLYGCCMVFTGITVLLLQPITERCQQREDEERVISTCDIEKVSTGTNTG